MRAFHKHQFTEKEIVDPVVISGTMLYIHRNDSLSDHHLMRCQHGNHASDCTAT